MCIRDRSPVMYFNDYMTFNSIEDVLESRTDCVIFASPLHFLPDVYEILGTEYSEQPLHLFVPTDNAVIESIRTDNLRIPDFIHNIPLLTILDKKSTPEMVLRVM